MIRPTAHPFCMVTSERGLCMLGRTIFFWLLGYFTCQQNTRRLVCTVWCRPSNVYAQQVMISLSQAYPIPCGIGGQTAVKFVMGYLRVFMCRHNSTLIVYNKKTTALLFRQPSYPSPVCQGIPRLGMDKLSKNR